MSKSHRNLEKLGSSCGSPVKRVCLEVYFGPNDIRGEIFTVGIELTNGLNVKFGCAGDGSVLVTKGLCSNSRPADAEEIQVRDLIQLADSVFEEIENLESVLRLKFSAGILEVKNADDELEVTYNDKPLHEDALTSRKQGKKRGQVHFRRRDG